MPDAMQITRAGGPEVFEPIGSKPVTRPLPMPVPAGWDCC
jgi:hypothetical protein